MSVERLEVGVGEPAVVELRAAGGTGYGWVVTSAIPDVAAEVGVARSTRPGMPGAPDVVPVTILAKAVGEHEVVLQLRRPWEDEPAEERRLAISAG